MEVFLRISSDLRIVGRDILCLRERGELIILID